VVKSVHVFLLASLFLLNTKVMADRSIAYARFTSNPASLEFTKIEDADLEVLPKGMLNAGSVLSILRVLAGPAHLGFVGKMLKKKPDGSCLKIKKLGGQVKGVHTGQLFAILYDQSCLRADLEGESVYKPLYILKESTKGFSELNNLFKVRKSPVGDKYIATEKIVYSQMPPKVDDEAKISFEDVHFKISLHHKSRYYSLLQTALGKSFQQHLVSFAESINEANDKATYEKIVIRMKHMFYRIGFSLSKLHQRYNDGTSLFGKTYTHGDLHAQNLFYDEVTDEVTLIDNETFSMSLKRLNSGINDIVDLYLLHSVKTWAHYFCNLYTCKDLNIEDSLWHELWHELLWGYLKAFEPIEDEYTRVLLFQNLQVKFTEGISNWKLFDSLRNLKDQRMLKRVGPSSRRSMLKEKELRHMFLNLSETWLN
jgi:hypothetical protein